MPESNGKGRSVPAPLTEVGGVRRLKHTSPRLDCPGLYPERFTRPSISEPSVSLAWWYCFYVPQTWLTMNPLLRSGGDGPQACASSGISRAPRARDAE